MQRNHNASTVQSGVIREFDPRDYFGPECVERLILLQGYGITRNATPQQVKQFSLFASRSGFVDEKSGSEPVTDTIKRGGGDICGHQASSTQQTQNLKHSRFSRTGQTNQCNVRCYGQTFNEPSAYDKTCKKKPIFLFEI